MWAKLRALLDEPTTWTRIHGFLTATWILLITPSVLFWRDSVAWIVIMSVWANVASSAASWQSARADRNSPSREDVQRVADRVVELLRRTPEREG